MWTSKRPASLIGGPQKKLVIKGLQALPTLPPTYKTDTLERLRSAVHAIQQNQPTPQGLEELYRDCESLCLHNFSSEVYSMLRTEFVRYTQQCLSYIDSQPDVSAAGSVLEQVRRFWEDYTQQLSMIRCIFLYLDRTYALNTASIESLWALGLSAVRQHLANTNMRSRLIRLFIGETIKERNGQTIDSLSLASICKMFVDLGLYTQFLQPSFIEATKEYYQKESLRAISSMVPILQSTEREAEMRSSNSMDVPGYLAHVQRRLDEESQRITHYLMPSTRSMLMATTLTELVERHVGKLLASSFDAMVDADMISDLGVLYSLLLQVSQLDALQQSWGAYIRKTGLCIMQTPDLDAVLVDRLLELKKKLDTILQDAFQKNARLVSALQSAFETFINTRRNKPAQLIARQVDNYLRSSSKHVVEQDLVNMLDRIIALFRFIQGKDLFEAYYRRDLAKRFLGNRNSDMDIERLMVQKLKTECGAGYTDRLEGMLRDMAISEELDMSDQQTTQQQDQQQSSPGAEDIGFRANVLTMAYWPSYDPLALVLPHQVEQEQTKFISKYSQTHRGRKLMWQHNLGTCLIKVNFDEGLKELQLSLVQGTVMLLFSEEDELTYTQIQQQTGLEDDELQRVLQSLACGRFRVLIKEPKGRAVNTTDKFEFNAKFKSPQVRIKISQIAVKEVETDTNEIEEHVHLDRMYRVDAALVRIMKARKTIEHSALSSELLGQLDFAISATEIKDRIETMLDRDYLRRDDADASTYHYIA
ncbi:cullin 4 [Coemansia reversa NRRL 1564]|uniref:Cullin 4 n=1 Tax=Coemansia reversa (strain ATCC 12441 / NRRL 1564) TaxID=763665 RepID=A0A2G5BK30_COERN|nr:cullin 4 [Coemansia reversa NRRL 1564]|eukprot:PIA19332.1 cullin 4 [Coemansia reversa NRRL 1564]